MPLDQAVRPATCPSRPTIASGYRKASEQLPNYQTTKQHCTSLLLFPLLFLPPNFRSLFSPFNSGRDCFSLVLVALYTSAFELPALPAITPPSLSAGRAGQTRHRNQTNPTKQRVCPSTPLPSPCTAPIANTTQPTREGSEASKPHPRCQLYHYFTMQPRPNCPRWPSPFAASSRISPPYYRGTASSPDGLPHLQTLSAKPLLSRHAQLPA